MFSLSPSLALVKPAELSSGDLWLRGPNAGGAVPGLGPVSSWLELSHSVVSRLKVLPWSCFCCKWGCRLGWSLDSKGEGSHAKETKRKGESGRELDHLEVPRLSRVCFEGTADLLLGRSTWSRVCSFVCLFACLLVYSFVYWFAGVFSLGWADGPFCGFADLKVISSTTLGTAQMAGFFRFV